MISKIKQLSSQEWAILILFIISIISLIATVEWMNYGEKDDAYVDQVEEEETDVLSYNWRSSR